MRIELLDDGRFILEAMSGQRITLIEQELSQLAKLAERYQDLFLSKPKHEVHGAVAAPISAVAVAVDAHHTEVVLTLSHQGYEQTFTFAPETAKDLIERIGRQLERINSPSQRRKQ